MRPCSGIRSALRLSAFALFVLLAACGQVERKAAHSAQELKYERDLRECAALAMRNFPLELRDWSIDSGMKSPAADSTSISAVDGHLLKTNSYRHACMRGKGWQQTSVEDLRHAPDSASAWDWGSQAPGEPCKHHFQCAENLYCRADVCASFMTAPWGGMERDDHCSAYYDCNIGLLCQKEVCTPAGADASGLPLLPGGKARGAPCGAHYQCGSGLLCRSEVCTPAAIIEVEPIGSKGLDASCTAHYQCARGMLCRNGVCG